MKNIILSFFTVILFTSCGTKTINPSEVVTKESIQTSMEYLTSDELAGRETGTPGIEKAAAFIENYFKQNNINPYFEGYRDNFQFNKKIKVGDTIAESIVNGFNIVGLIEGNDPELKDEYIILGGHYDHLGKGRTVEGDSIANGANDDASGTVAAMEMGKYFAKSKTNKRSILITLFDAEEMGLKGSSHLAEKLKNKGSNIYSMVNFEMIGVPRGKDETMTYITGYKRSNLAETLNKYGGEEIVGFFDKSNEMNLFKRSDNYPFFKALNIPAHAISTFDFTNYEYYHHVDDEADKMDYNHMTNIILKMIPAFEGMMNASTREVVLKDE